jgi:hypothetical protein
MKVIRGCYNMPVYTCAGMTVFPSNLYSVTEQFVSIIFNHHNTILHLFLFIYHRLIKNKLISDK